jgi:hypothetical protein
LATKALTQAASEELNELKEQVNQGIEVGTRPTSNEAFSAAIATEAGPSNANFVGKSAAVNVPQSAVCLAKLQQVASAKCPALAALCIEDSVEDLRQKLRAACSVIPDENKGPYGMFCLQICIPQRSCNTIAQAEDLARQLLPNAPEGAIYVAPSSVSKAQAVHMQVLGLDERQRLIERASACPTPVRVHTCLAYDRCGCHYRKHNFLVELVQASAAEQESKPAIVAAMSAYIAAKVPNAKVDAVVVLEGFVTKVMLVANGEADDMLLVEHFSEGGQFLIGRNQYKLKITSARHERYFQCKCGEKGHGLSKPCPKRALAVRFAFKRPVNAYDLLAIRKLCPQVELKLQTPGASLVARCFPSSKQDQLAIVLAIVAVEPNLIVSIQPLFVDGLNADERHACFYCNCADHVIRDCPEVAKNQGRRAPSAPKRGFASFAEAAAAAEQPRVVASSGSSQVAASGAAQVVMKSAAQVASSKEDEPAAKKARQAQAKEIQETKSSASSEQLHASDIDWEPAEGRGRRRRSKQSARERFSSQIEADEAEPDASNFQYTKILKKRAAPLASDSGSRFQPLSLSDAEATDVSQVPPPTKPRNGDPMDVEQVVTVNRSGAGVSPADPMNIDG